MKKANSEVIERLHIIFESEIIGMRVFETEESVEKDIATLFLNTPSSSVLSSEFVDDVMTRYNTNQDFRHIFDSVSASLSTWIALETDIDITDFVIEAVKSFSIDQTIFTGERSLTNPQLSQFRIDFAQRYPEVYLYSPVDFWLVCLMLLRVTMYRSTIISQFVSSVIVGKNQRKRRGTGGLPATFTNTPSAAVVSNSQSSN